MDSDIFISYAHEDKEFAKEFRNKLQDKLGNSITVWLDDRLKNGKEWRRELQRKLNQTALVVVILSPDSLKSLWVTYEWHYFLLVLQSEPYFVYFRQCEETALKRLRDYQFELEAPLVLSSEEPTSVWSTKENEIDRIVDEIAARVQVLPTLREYFKTITNRVETAEAQIEAARLLGEVSEDLKLAATNYLLESLQFWMSYGAYGPVLRSIVDALGRLRKRKAIPTIGQLYGHTGDADVLAAIKRALYLLSCEEPL